MPQHSTNIRAIEASKLIFKDLQIGESFWLTGINFIKKSTRTAYRFGQPKRWEYFKDDQVVFDNRMASILYEKRSSGFFL